MRVCEFITAAAKFSRATDGVFDVRARRSQKPDVAGNSNTDIEDAVRGTGKRCFALFVLFVVASLGCSHPAPPTPAPKATEATEPAKTPGQKAAAAVGGAAGVTMSGIKLFLYDKGPGVEGVAKKAVLRIEADTFSSTGEKEWAFDQAHAFMVSRKTQEEWNIDAAKGRLKEDANAFLEGGVVAHLGTMTIDLQDITFETPTDDAPKAAFSDHPVTVKDPGMDLQAASVKLYPDEKRFELTDVAGAIRFTKETQ